MILFPDFTHPTTAAYDLDRTATIGLDGPGGAYSIHVSCPSGAMPAAGWPVTYMLDGDTFPVIREILCYQVGHGAPGLPEPRMLVAVGYTGASRRAHDYAPECIDAHEAKAGGAAAFRQFLLGAVRQAVESRWPVDPARQTLMGHSLGGLFVLDTLFCQPGAFGTWVASSPSVWWRSGYLSVAAARFAASGVHAIEGTRVLLTAAEYDQSLTPAEERLPDQAREDLLNTRIERAMVDGNRELARVLSGVSGLTVHYRFLPGETHRSAWPCAAAHAFRA